MDQNHDDWLNAENSVRMLFENFYRIRDKLSNRFLTVSDVTGMLDLTKRQVSYWNSKWLQWSDRRVKHRAWQKFAIIDLLGFAVVRKLRGFGFTVDRCIEIFDTVRRAFLEENPYVYNYSVGNPVILVMDMESTNIDLYAGLLSEEQFYKEMTKTPKPVVIIPLSPLLSSILEKTKRSDFYIEYLTDEQENKWKVIFYVDGKRLEFERLGGRGKKSDNSSKEGNRNSNRKN